MNNTKLSSVNRKIFGRYIILAILAILMLICFLVAVKNVMAGSYSSVVGNLIFFSIVSYVMRNSLNTLKSLKSMKSALTLGK